MIPVKAQQHHNLFEKKQELKICLLWQSIYLGNMGVNALTYATLRYLEEVAEHLNLHFTYHILGHGHKDDCTDEVVISGKSISVEFKKIRLPSVDIQRLHGWRVLLRWLLKRSRSFINYLAQYDLILDISEGDSFTDIYGSARFIEMSLSKILALAAEKPLVVLLPQTIGPFNHGVARIIAHQIMRRIEHIYPRDQTSCQYLKKAIRGRTFHPYLDVAFHLPYEKIHFVPEKIHVGLNISGLLWHGGYTQDNMFKLQVDYKQVIRETIRFFLETENVLVHLVPHVISFDRHSLEADNVVCEEIHQDMPETVMAPAFKSPVEAKSYISGLDFFAGARMHSCIAAYSAGVPVIPMAYSRKFTGLFLSSLNYPVFVDLRNDSQEQIHQKIQTGFEDRAALRQAILTKEGAIQNDITAFRQELINIVGQVYEV